MVDFLLDNTLGAWHAGKRMKDEGGRMKFATEEEARQFCALPGCPWKYLRFIKVPPDGEAAAPTSSFIPHPSSFLWTPAAGTFDGWPTSAAALRALDPCMGSGHFVVAMFQRLVALRVAEEKLDDAAAVAAVIRDNLFGLEIDPRCTQIGAFNLALAAWRRVGHCKLPAMNLACSGLAPNTREADWLAIAGDNQKLQRGMERLYRLFQKAAVLGSLINPRAGEGDLLVAAFHELQPLLEKALAQETKDDTAHEMAVTARGLAKAAEILAGQFTLVATNVPYLGQKKQDDLLKEYCERVHPDAKADLATCFVERCLEFCANGCSATLVTPQNWLFLGTFKKMRQRLLKNVTWDWVVRLGPKGFQTPMWDFNISLISVTKQPPKAQHFIAGLDVANKITPAEKATNLESTAIVVDIQAAQLANPDSRITLSSLQQSDLLDTCAFSAQGIGTTDNPRFLQGFWEQHIQSREWESFQTSANADSNSNGCSIIFRWGGPGSDYFRHIEALKAENRIGGGWQAGGIAWGKTGFAVNVTGKKVITHYSRGKFDTTVGIIVPRDAKHAAAIYSFLTSPEYSAELEKIDPTLSVTEGTLVKVPFDLAHWQKVAAEEYPDGLPKPFSSDPTQWLFNGHPAGADQPLHVAVARLLGYQWPRQTGSSFPDCPALGPDGLETLADDDGIVPISPAKGEGPAAERLRELLARAYGKDWNATRQEALLAQVDYAGASLEDWLRNGFFEQHCALFQHRPFIWHVWDGLKNGFSALVNYHKLTHASLEKLTFAYLGDWIRRQQAAVAAEEAGSDAKLQAAKQLQATLKLILEGEPPYDIFVRWKGLAQQPIGWHPDLNDGVRMNIRPFMLAPDVGKKGAGILRIKPNIKWDKDRGKEPPRDKKEYPWFWKGSEFTGDRLNDIHVTREEKAATLKPKS